MSNERALEAPGWMSVGWVQGHPPYRFAIALPLTLFHKKPSASSPPILSDDSDVANPASGSAILVRIAVFLKPGIDLKLPLNPVPSEWRLDALSRHSRP